MNRQILRNACVLGLIDAILVGVFSGASVAIYVERRNGRILEQILDRTLLTETFHLIENRELIWIICLSFFVWLPVLTFSSWLVHKYLFEKVQSLILLWEYIGVAGVFVASLITIAAVEVDFFLRGRHYGESNVNDNLLPISKVMTVALVAVLLINYLYGAALNISPRLYRAFKQAGSADLQLRSGK